MGFYKHYLDTAAQLILSYDGKIPFTLFLKDFFRSRKQYGSRDRKQVAGLCYSFFRVAKPGHTTNLERTLLTSYFLCHPQKDKLLEVLSPELHIHSGKSIESKLQLVNIEPGDLFVCKEALSNAFQHDAFYLSFLQQPSLFLRSRPGKNEIVLQKLSAAQISAKTQEDGCIQLPNNTQLQEILELNREAVVQDASSQKVLRYLHQVAFEKAPNAWDACAASGGKSILLHDTLNGKVKITASDLRPSMLQNLTNRLAEAGVNLYRKFTIDLTRPLANTENEKFDIIIADVPCSGSGTWARTPEEKFFFVPENLPAFTERQYKIAENLLPFLGQGSLMFYITCSVFRAENEEIVNKILQNFNVSLVQQQYIPGYEAQADSMFVAILKKN